MDWTGDRAHHYNGGCACVHSRGQEYGVKKVGRAEMENQIQEQGLSRPFAFIFSIRSRPEIVLQLYPEKFPGGNFRKTVQGGHHFGNRNC